MRPKSQRKPTGSRGQCDLPTAAGAINLNRPKIILASRLLLNDQIWSQGDVVVVENGRTVDLTPRFWPRCEPLLQSGELRLTHY